MLKKNTNQGVTLRFSKGERKARPACFESLSMTPLFFNKCLLILPIS